MMNVPAVKEVTFQREVNTARMDNVQIVKKNGWSHGWRIKVMDRSSKDIWAVSRAVLPLDHQEKCPEKTRKRIWIQFHSCEGLISPEKPTCLVFCFQNHQMLFFINLHWKWRNKSWNLKIHAGKKKFSICPLLKHTSIGWVAENVKDETFEEV